VKLTTHPPSAEVKEWVELYLHSPNTPSWRGVQHGDNLTSTLRFLVVVAAVKVTAFDYSGRTGRLREYQNSVLTHKVAPNYWCSDNVLDTHSESTQFEFGSSYRPSWLSLHKNSVTFFASFQSLTCLSPSHSWFVLQRT